jgi:tripartite-type tricarboxylate transporter receptor subunit TctC
MYRRRLMRAAMAALVLLSLSSPALRAQTFDHTVRLIVPNAPGGTSDILARLMAPDLTRAIGQNVVIENRAGAGGNLGADLVAKSPPDGHTILLMDLTTLATNPAMFPRLPFDAARDLAPVSMLVFAPYILGVNNALPVRSAAELEAYARANPGKLNAANAGTGTSTHLALVMLSESWGAGMTHVPYKGGAPALLAVSTGEANLTVQGTTQSQPFALNGQMRPLAVTGPHRLASLPQTPTFTELKWPAANAGTWQGLMVQGGTPPALAERLTREIRTIMAQPGITARLSELGAEARVDGPDALRSWLAAQTEDYGRVIRANNIQPE